jgi:hypothetical protein
MRLRRGLSGGAVVGADGSVGVRAEPPSSTGGLPPVRTAVSGRETVEWAYAFDVHCNAYVPVIVLLHLVQYLLLPVVLGPSLGATVVANSLHLLAAVYYWYLVFLGFNTLPFLQNTVQFLYPAGVAIVAFILSVLLNINASRLSVAFHFPHATVQS